MAFNEKSRQVDELTTSLAKRDQVHAAELAANAKAECEAAWSSELEQLEELEANCNDMRSQRSAAEKQLGEVEADLLEVKERNRHLTDQTNDALTEKIFTIMLHFDNYLSLQ
ncbi:hypothetical protein AXG93_392s1590 [Marchantia polymorpha subsp. ruderalis]|uniref:Uncharacterized protein n=1 Tax=Marchantia polymorpha subsp. ruderalis TaxID=1480154 RepID=A0A176WQB3_MARPO|nr:hypothetical protein AXG93_392s1590 [Marchantia polymorpha subsp. ruderalis]